MLHNVRLFCVYKGFPWSCLPCTENFDRSDLRPFTCSRCNFAKSSKSVVHILLCLFSLSCNSISHNVPWSITRKWICSQIKLVYFEKSELVMIFNMVTLFAFWGNLKHNVNVHTTNFILMNFQLANGCSFSFSPFASGWLKLLSCCLGLKNPCFLKETTFTRR